MNICPEEHKKAEERMSFSYSERSCVAPCIPPQKPNGIFLKIEGQFIGIMDNNRCMYLNKHVMHKNTSKSIERSNAMQAAEEQNIGSYLCN
jgi:hypothetical protein